MKSSCYTRFALSPATRFLPLAAAAGVALFAARNYGREDVTPE